MNALDIASVARRHNVLRARGVDADGPNLVVRERIAARLNLALTGVEMRYPTLGVGYPELIAIGRNVYTVDEVLGREKFSGLASRE